MLVACWSLGVSVGLSGGSVCPPGERGENVLSTLAIALPVAIALSVAIAVRLQLHPIMLSLLPSTLQLQLRPCNCSPPRKGLQLQFIHRTISRGDPWSHLQSRASVQLHPGPGDLALPRCGRCRPVWPPQPRSSPRSVRPQGTPARGYSVCTARRPLWASLC